MGFGAPQHMGSFQTRDQTHVFCIGRQIPYRWDTREAPSCFFFLIWPCLTACGILVPQLGTEPIPWAVKAQSPNHWTAKGVPTCSKYLTEKLFSWMMCSREFLLVLGWIHHLIHKLFYMNQTGKLKYGAGIDLVKDKEKRNTLTGDWNKCHNTTLCNKLFG